MLPVLQSFLEKFSNVVVENNINVITDSMGNMSIDVPSSMSEAKYTEVSQRIGIIDRIITTKGTEINDLFQKGKIIEDALKLEDSKYVSQLSKQIQIFKELNNSYKH